MKRLTSISSLALSATIIGVATINVNQVEAATITYDIVVNNLSGSLLGNTYNGSFTFDNIGFIGSGSEFFSVTDLSFDFLGTTYTENDANSPFGAEAEFLDGDFIGLSYSTDAGFSFIPGFFSLNDSFFAYNFGSGDSGTGDIVYSIRTPESRSVPEPSSVLGIFVVASVLTVSKSTKFVKKRVNVLITKFNLVNWP